MTVDDGPATTTGPTWSFTTEGPSTGTIIVEKQTTPDGAPDSFTFTGDAAGTITDGGQIVVSGLRREPTTRKRSCRRAGP